MRRWYKRREKIEIEKKILGSKTFLDIFSLPLKLHSNSLEVIITLFGGEN